MTSFKDFANYFVVQGLGGLYQSRGQKQKNDRKHKYSGDTNTGHLNTG